MCGCLFDFCYLPFRIQEKETRVLPKWQGNANGPLRLKAAPMASLFVNEETDFSVHRIKAWGQDTYGQFACLHYDSIFEWLFDIHSFIHPFICQSPLLLFQNALGFFPFLSWKKRARRVARKLWWGVLLAESPVSLSPFDTEPVTLSQGVGEGRQARNLSMAWERGTGLMSDCPFCIHSSYYLRCILSLASDRKSVVRLLPSCMLWVSPAAMALGSRGWCGCWAAEMVKWLLFKKRKRHPMHGKHNFYTNRSSVEIKRKTYWITTATECFFLIS